MVSLRALTLFALGQVLPFPLVVTLHQSTEHIRTSLTLMILNILARLNQLKY
jgi:hypothetical protein